MTDDREPASQLLSELLMQAGSISRMVIVFEVEDDDRVRVYSTTGSTVEKLGLLDLARETVLYPSEEGEEDG